MTDKTSLSYKDAGVDIDAGNALVERIKGVVKETRRPEVMGVLVGSVHYVPCHKNTASPYLFQVPTALGQNYVWQWI